MAKFTIQKTDILFDGKLYPEGSEIELPDEESVNLEEYLTLIPEKKTAKAKSEDNTNGETV